MVRIVLATGNQHKAGEFKPLLADLPVTLLTLEDFPFVRGAEEDQDTLEGNALKKARKVHRETRLPALADDSGLEVYYLNDEPGVFSSRYAGLTASYADNCKKLLACMRGVPPRRRAARFRCVLAFVAPGIEKTVEGILPGVITEIPHGKNGFGYDPVFLPQGHNQTLAEMSSELKNTLSHRAKAVEMMKTTLLEYSRLHE